MVKLSQHVLVVGSYAPSLVNFRGAMISEMVARGHQVSVAAPDIDNSVREKMLKLGAKTFNTPLQRTGLNPMADFRYLRTLKHLMDEIQPNLVITYTVKPNIYGGIAARIARVRSVAMVTGLGYAFTGVASMRQRVIRYIVSALYRLSTGFNDVVVFQNPDDRDDFVAAGCLHDHSKIQMMNGSGVDTSFYSQAPLPDAPVFLMISRLLGNKGVREYGEAAVATKKDFPEAQFLLVGYFDEGPDGITRNEIDTWIAGGLEYLGPVHDVREAIAAASVYVLPSYREGTPRSVLEAMSVGRPILTSDAPGCRETTVNGVNGFLVPIKDSVALAQRMRWMIENTSTRSNMGIMSRKIAITKYDVHVVNNVFLANIGLP